jgi:hypothetical protein
MNFSMPVRPSFRNILPNMPLSENVRLYSLRQTQSNDKFDNPPKKDVNL